jgi:hypothetical protein
MAAGGNYMPRKPKDTSWKEHWQGMPEFVQDKQKPYAQLTVRFDSAEALAAFATLIGQPLTQKTKAIWHPALVRGQNSHLRYAHEEQISPLCNLEGSSDKMLDSTRVEGIGGGVQPSGGADGGGTISTLVEE